MTQGHRILKRKLKPIIGIFLKPQLTKSDPVRIFICVNEDDENGMEVKPKDLSPMLNTYHPVFWDAEADLVTLKRQGVGVPNDFDCVLSQSKLMVPSGVDLTIEGLGNYWWEYSKPESLGQHACYIFGLTDGPDFGTLQEENAVASYEKRLARITDFVASK